MTSLQSPATDRAVIELTDVCKTFQLFSTPLDQFLHAARLHRLLRRRGPIGAKAALSGINLSVQAGEKVGIIGQNGSGKTTLLKLIIDSAHPTSGHVKVVGKLQALMTTGAAISDDLSGRDCIHSALVLNGLTDREEGDAFDDIADFVELGEFLNYPVRTYSLGMRARLEFAIATAINPDILVIDEVMGAGDGYFAQKSAKRMRDLTARCTLLLVSHSMQQILDFCDRVIWLDDGAVVADGAPGAVIKAYEDFMVKRDARIRTSIQMAEHTVEADGRSEEEQRRSFLDARVATVRRKSRDLLPVGDPAGLPLPKLLFAAFAGEDERIHSTETGKPVQIEIGLRIPEGVRHDLSLSILALSENGNLIWASRELAVPAAVGEHTLVLSTTKVIAGVGDYFLSIGVGKAGDRVMPFLDALHAELILRLVTTNFSDPPYFHCPSRWQYGGDVDETVDGRISAWV